MRAATSSSWRRCRPWRTITCAPATCSSTTATTRSRKRAVQEGFIAAEAAGEQGYQWQFVYLLFRNQDQAERFGVTNNLLESIANSIGELDVPQWKDDFAAGGGEGGAITERLQAQDETARGLGLRAEPSAIVNGPRGTRTLQDSPTLAQIERAIEAVS